MDLVTQIIEYESGGLSEKQTVHLFADLIKTGTAWKLQGSYGRMAKSFIDQEIIDKEGKILIDELI